MSFVPLGKMETYTVDRNTVRFTVTAGDRTVPVELALYQGGLLRYRLFPRTPDYDLVLADTLKPVALEVLEQGDVLSISAESVRIRARRDQWRLEVFRGDDSRPVLSELPDDVDAHDAVISEPTGYWWNGERVEAARINLALDPHETLTGLGEKHTSLDRRGREFSCWNVNPYGAGRETAYKNIPFLVSTRCYGLFLNETRRSRWDVGAVSNFSLSLTVDGPSFDLFLLVAEGLPEVLARYADLTGHAPLPPRWSFGLWISPFGEQRLSPGGLNQDELLTLTDEIRSREIPCDVIHLDPYWMGDNQLCHFNWDRDRYPDPAALVAELRERGMRLCLWEHPYFEKGGETYEEAARQGYLLKRSDGSVYDSNLAYIPPSRREAYTESFYAPAGIVDFTNPDAVEWYKSKHRPHLDMGVATFKSDFGEMIPEDAVFSNGLTGAEMHNLYPLLYNRTVFEVIGEAEKRPVVWGRSGYAGSQRYPVQWSGDPLPDFKSLAATIRAGLSYGMSGVPFWTFDLGGFKGQPTTAAYLRWAQVGLLVSHSRFHGTTPRLPWHYGEQAERIVRDAVRMRYRLLPYIYAVSQIAVQTGLPVIRPLLLEFPDDHASGAVDLEYMLGPSILVVPVLNEQGQVEIYLPPGGWYEYGTGQRFQGPVQMSRVCELSDLPVFVREDAILPFSLDDRTVAEFWDPLGVEIFPSADGRIQVPEENGHEATTVVVVREGSTTRVRGDGPVRSWVVSFRGVTAAPESVDVECDGEYSWNFHQESQVVEVRLTGCGVFETRIPNR